MAEWTTFGADTLSEAQKRLGLSDERVARQIPVATRTWIRWRQAHRVPTAHVPRVAEILALEVASERRLRVVTQPQEASDVARLEDKLDQVLGEVQRLREGQDAIELRLGRLEVGQAPPGSGRAATS